MFQYFGLSITILTAILSITTIIISIHSKSNTNTDIGTDTNEVATPVNCAVSSWGNCSKTCGTGTKTRTVLQQPKNSGNPCPSLTSECNTQVCPPVNCAVSSWGNCSKTCGTGTKTRTVLQQPENGGNPCPSLTSECNTQACPVNCAVSTWGNCSKTCGTGTKTRTVLQQPENGGDPCPSLTSECNTQACPPVNCAVSDWGTTCSKACGTGIQTRTITTDPENGGNPCPSLTRDCNTHSCAVLYRHNNNSMQWICMNDSSQGTISSDRIISYSTGTPPIDCTRYDG